MDKIFSDWQFKTNYISPFSTSNLTRWQVQSFDIKHQILLQRTILSLLHQDRWNSAYCTYIDVYLKQFVKKGYFYIFSFTISISKFLHREFLSGTNSILLFNFLQKVTRKKWKSQIPWHRGGKKEIFSKKNPDPTNMFFLPS